MPHFMIVLNLLNISWIKKMSIFEEYGAFKACQEEDMPDAGLEPVSTCLHPRLLVWCAATKQNITCFISDRFGSFDIRIRTAISGLKREVVGLFIVFMYCSSKTQLDLLLLLKH